VRAALALAWKDRYSQREIAEAVGISHQRVGRYLRPINDASISLSDVLALNDDAHEEF
jgi:transcriptional regulator with XRE-family HTH domain